MPPPPNNSAPAAKNNSAPTTKRHPYVVQEHWVEFKIEDDFKTENLTPSLCRLDSPAKRQERVELSQSALRRTRVPAGKYTLFLPTLTKARWDPLKAEMRPGHHSPLVMLVEHSDFPPTTEIEFSVFHEFEEDLKAIDVVRARVSGDRARAIWSPLRSAFADGPGRYRFIFVASQGERYVRSETSVIVDYGEET